MNNQLQWANPVPLRPNRSNFIKFPADAMPPILREMAVAIAETTSTDVAMAGTALLSAVGYCFTGVYRMYGKADHSEPLVLNSLTVAEPSLKIACNGTCKKTICAVHNRMERAEQRGNHSLSG